MAEYVYKHRARQHEALWSTFDLITIVAEDRRRVYLGGYSVALPTFCLTATTSSA